MNPTSKVIATIFALSAFCIAVYVGLSAGNTGSAVLGRAIVAMVVCYSFGRVIAGVALGVVDDHIALYRSTHPISTPPSSSIESETPTSGSDVVALGVDNNG